MNRYKRLASHAAVSFAVLAGTVSMRGQDASTTPAGGSTEDIVKLEKFTANDVPVEKVIMPNARPFSSVFGTDQNIIDVPRNVTIISREQMDIINIQDVTDFSKLTASSYTDSNFGAPGNPSIRGQSADIFVNGMRQRTTSNGNGSPLDFNSIESVNILKGPATAIQGVSGYVGGFADMITKQPYFDRERGSISYTMGSYNTNRWALDVGGPINPTLAYRLSYSGEDSNEYWNDAFKHTESLYTAVTWRPSNNYELFVNAKIFAGKFSENFGIDRPTQLLIDQGLYQSGININNGAGAAPSNDQNSRYVLSGGNTIAWGPLVPVNYHWRLQGPGSQSHSHEYNAQAVQTLIFSPEAKIKNNTFFSLTQRDTYGTHYYSEVIAPTWFVENRTEFVYHFKDFNDSVIDFGVAERYQHTKAYDDFFFEPANVWDLSKSRAGLALDSINFPSGDFGAVPVPGWAGRYATAGIINSDTNDSQDTSIAPFAQGTWKANDQLSLVAGARADYLHIKVKDPLTVGTPSASINVVDPNLNLSVLYKPMPTVSTYATYNFSRNFTGALANGGGFAGLLSNGAGGWYLSKDNFDQKSELFEIGAKDSLLNNRLFLNTAIFQQSRQQKAQGQPATQQKFRGFEFEANYQPDKHFYATFGYSFLSGSADAPPSFQAYATNQIPNGPPDPFTSVTQTKGKLRVPGYPLHTFNALFTYNLDNGFGASLGSVVTSPINNDYQGYLVIPWQKTIDVSVFYRTKSWELRLSVNNVTNEHNWTPAYPTYGLSSIVPDPGAEFFATVRTKF